MRSRTLSAAMATAFGLVALTACSGSENGSDSSMETATATAEPSAWDEPVEVLWANDEELMSEVEVVDGVALAYVSIGNQEESVVAWDATTGDELWREQAIPGTRPTGVEHGIPAVEIDGMWTTAFLDRHEDTPNNTWGHLAVVDVHTGMSKWPEQGNQLLWSDRPSECGDTYCLTGLIWEVDDEPIAKHLDIESGALEDGPHDEADNAGEAPFLPPGGVFVGEYISVTAPGETSEALNYGADGEVKWSRPYTDVFGDGKSINGGWHWLDYEPDLPVIGFGSPYEERDGTQPFEASDDLDANLLVGLDRGTGETLWSLEGTAPCRSTSFGYLPNEDSEQIIVCRFNSGTASYSYDGEEVSDRVYADVDLEIISVDPHSGNVKWAQPLGSDPANFAFPSDGGSNFETGSSIVSVINDAAALVDADSGATQEFPEGAALLCAQEPEPITLTSSYSQGEPIDYYLADVVGPCSSKADELSDSEISRGTLDLAGYESDEIAVINLTSGVTAFAPSEP